MLKLLSFVQTLGNECLGSDNFEVLGSNSKLADLLITAQNPSRDVTASARLNV